MASITPPSSGTTTPDYRAALAARLRGQTIIVPDVLRTIYSSPIIRLNDTAYLNRPIDDWLEKYVPTIRQRAKKRKANIPLISSYFWTRVPMHKFEVLASFMAWIFLWDDEIDCGSLTLDQDQRTDAYCDDAIDFIKSCMQPELNLSRPVAGRLHHSGCFVDIGIAMQDGQNKADRDRYVNALIAYIDSVRASQAQWQVGVDSVEDFIDRRSKTIAVYPTLYTHAWAYSIKLPEWVWDHESVQAMVREVSVTVALYNDMASLKKELKADEVDNIIPILVYHHNVSAQEAVDMTVQILEGSYKAFTAAVERLRCTVDAESEDVKRDVEVWVDACVDMLVGNVAWSLAIPRYLPRTAFSDGSLEFEVVL
jgi:hypothetical protein